MNDLDLDAIAGAGADTVQDVLDETAEFGATQAPAETASWCRPEEAIEGARCGVLVGMKDGGRTPLVVFSGQRGSARNSLLLMGFPRSVGLPQGRI